MSLLANEFSTRHGFEVELIIYGKSREIFYALDDGIKVRTPNFQFDNRLRFINTIRTARFLRSLIASGGYHAILSFGERWNSFVMLSCLGVRKKIFLSDRSSPSLNLGILQERLRRWLYPRASGLIAQTKRAEAIAIDKHLHRDIVVIPNPVSCTENEGSVKRENVVLSVGRLIATKHHDRLIKTFAEINAPDWRLLIIGDEAQRQEHRARLETLIRELEVENRVSLVGSQSDIEKAYRKAKVFAFTSSSEGFPNVIAEALAMGLPVVAYDCDAGPSDLIQDGRNGYLVELFDDSTFKTRLGALMKDAELRQRMSNASREAVQPFAPERVALEYLQAMGVVGR